LLGQLTPFFAGSGNGRHRSQHGSAGESKCRVRNLTTLVLINGSASFGSGFSLGPVLTSTRFRLPRLTISTLKDGASTIYGTDAIGAWSTSSLKRIITL